MDLNKTENGEGTELSRLESLLLRHEDETLDFKQHLNKTDRIAKTIAAFSNNRGGQIIIGISDDRQVTGVDVEEEKYLIDQALHFFDPDHLPIIEFEEIDWSEDKGVLIVHVQEAETKPLYLMHPKQGGRQVYFRQKDKSIPVGKHMIRALKSAASSKGLGSPVKEKPRLDKVSGQIIAYLQKESTITENEVANKFNCSKSRAKKTLQKLLVQGLIGLDELKGKKLFFLITS